MNETKGNYQVKKFSVAIAVEQHCCNGQNQSGGALSSLFAAEQQRYVAKPAMKRNNFKLS